MKKTAHRHNVLLLITAGVLAVSSDLATAPCDSPRVRYHATNQ